MTPEIVLGPPGCGKTEYLMGRVERLIERGVEPEQIALLAFTRRAAEEFVFRACEKFALPASRFPWFRTIHSLCFRTLGTSRSEMLADDRLREFADWTGVDLTPRSSWAAEGHIGQRTGDRILHLDYLARVTGAQLRDVYDEEDHELPWSEVRRVSTDLLAFKRAKGLLDFTDLLLNFLHGPPPRLRLRAVLVDEAQDLSMLQWGCVAKLLAPEVEEFVVAGDDDQSVYAWAGAALDHFLRLEGQVTVLSQSYRVPQQIQALALGVLSRVEQRRAKAWAPRTEAGEVKRAVHLDEVDWPVGEDVLVLARNHLWLERDVAPLLRLSGVYYAVGGEPSVPVETVAALRGWEALRRGEEVSEGVWATLRRWLPSEFKAPTQDLLSKPWFEALTRMPPDEMSYILASRTRGELLGNPPRVRLSTIHGSKGGQASTVVLLTDVARRTAREAERRPDDEARVWYVGVTRARERLWVVSRPDAPHSQNI